MSRSRDFVDVFDVLETSVPGSRHSTYTVIKRKTDWEGKFQGWEISVPDAGSRGNANDIVRQFNLEAYRHHVEYWEDHDQWVEELKTIPHPYWRNHEDGHYCYCRRSQHHSFHLSSGECVYIVATKEIRYRDNRRR